jgi:hypothetical protein
MQSDLADSSRELREPRMQYFVVMIDYGRRGREAIVDPEITRREMVSRVASGEYSNISFIHEIADSTVEDITEEILAEAAVPEIAAADADLQASRLDICAICASMRRCEGGLGPTGASAGIPSPVTPRRLTPSKSPASATSTPRSRRARSRLPQEGRPRRSRKTPSASPSWRGRRNRRR